MKDEPKPQPKADDYNDDRVVAPPDTVTVVDRARVVLYRPDGTPLKRQIGFKVSP